MRWSVLACLLAACETDPCLRSGTICTIAGMAGQAGLGAEGEPALSTWLYLPMDVVARDGSVWIADDNNHAIREVRPDGTLHTVAGSRFLGDGPEGDALLSSLNHPASLTLDPADPDTLWIAATGNHRIKRLNLADGTISLFSGTGDPGFFGDGGPAADARLERPTSVAFDDDGRMYVSDKVNQVIRQIDEGGTIRTFAGDPGLYGYFGDGGPAADARLHSPPTAPLDPGNRITVANGHLCIADTGNHVVRQINLQSGLIRTIAGRATPGNDPDETAPLEARLDTPHDVAVAPDGTLYIADSNNHCVRALTPDGFLQTAAGVCGEEGSDGDAVPADEAHLNYPTGVFVDADGFLWIADTVNHLVRRMAP